MSDTTGEFPWATDDPVGVELKQGRSMGRVWFVSDSMLVIIPPPNFKTLEVSTGAPVQIHMPTADGLEAYTGDIHEVRGVPALFVKNVKRNKQIQRRHAMRVNIKLKVLMWLNENDLTQSNAITCTSVNLSASGVLITVEKNIASRVDDRVLLQVAISGERTITTRGVIKRFNLKGVGEGSYYEVGIQFDDLDASDREMLVKYVLRKQFEKQL